VNSILEFKDSEEGRPAAKGEAESHPELSRLKSSKKLIEELKTLFAFLTRSDKKYADPTDVLKAIVDDYGKTIQIGEEKDIGEFNQTFLARISEGLNYSRIMADEEQKS
jgi:hypothetical protein